MPSPEVSRALGAITPGTHAVLVYDTKENKEDILFTHLKLGREHDGLFYIPSEETPAEAEAGLKRFGLDVEGRQRSGTLSVKNYDEVYIIDGKVNSPEIVSGFSKLAWSYFRRGHQMRASAEMSCFFDRGLVPELVSYERDLHTRFSFPAMGLCGYNLMKMYSSGGLDAIWPILKAHELVILTGPGGNLALKSDEVRPVDFETTMGKSIGSIKAS